MFVLSELKDVVRVLPNNFNLSLESAIKEDLNRKLSNKVVHRLGLCVCLWDILLVDDSFIIPGDGASHTNVTFRFVVFRPFMDEVLVGKISSCSKDGVHVSLGFFDDILIPGESLQQPARFDEREQVWIWEYVTEDGQHDLHMDVGESVRFKVTDEQFVDTTPDLAPEHVVKTEAETVDGKKIPYLIIGTMAEPGLGLVNWWTSSD